eukprot:gb/GECG01003477.1/.p1 GENE.gb/GECG01003477.1/~~gb/GECG01003477.1/.p1  ORF type:complete len:694 (+),score=29.96 gb/GECG01003477.1/:1-2082(+)
MAYYSLPPQQQWCPFACGVGFLTLSVWWWMSQRQQKKHPYSHEPTLSYMLIGSLCVMAGSSYLLRTALDDPFDGAFMVFVGATTFVACTLLHHFSLCIPVVGTAMLLAVLHDTFSNYTIDPSTPWSQTWETISPLIPPYGFGAAVFLFSFLICQQNVVHVFGRGVALFSIVVTLILLVFLLVDPAPLRGIHISLLSCLPFLLINTGLPHYLKSGRSRGLTTASILIVSFFLIATSVTEQRVFGISLLTSAVLALLLAKFSSLAAVLGPYYNYERRAFVLLNTSFAIVSFRICSAIEEGIFSERLAWYLLAISLGFSFALCVIAINTLGVGAWEPVTAASHRVAALDFFASVSMFTVGCWILVAKTETVPSLIEATSSALQHGNQMWLRPYSMFLLEVPWLRNLGLDRLHPSWIPCIASVCLMHLATVVWRAIIRSTAFMAPLVSEVRTKSSQYCMKYSLTFNGVPEEKKCNALLEKLRTNDIQATFFVDTDSAEISGKILEQIHQEGHEVACLGRPGLHSTSEILEDISRGKRAIEKYLGVTNSHSSGQGSPSLRRRTRSSSGITRRKTQENVETVSPVWYRPRDGSRDIRVLRAANRAGLTVALWSVCVYDWDASREDIKARLENQVHGGGGDIILLHCVLPDYLKPPAAANRPEHDVLVGVEEVIKHTNERLGQEAVTLTDLCADVTGREV